MRKIISISVFMLLLYLTRNYLKYSEVYGIINIALAVMFIYLIATIIKYVRKPDASNRTIETLAPETTSKTRGNLWIFMVIVSILLVLFFKKALGTYSFGVFVFLDNLVKFTPSMHPWIAWGLPGLLIGAVYGSMVAWRKYKLNFAINLIPLGIFIFAVVILFMINNPLASTQMDTSVILSDTAMDINASLKKFIVNRWKVVDVLGKNRANFIRRKNNITEELEFKKNGQCYLYKNGVRSEPMNYTVDPDGRSISIINPDNSQKILQIQIISILKDELVLKSELYQNDTTILKAR